ncbi:MAG: bifunctional hydroxymethylpyrimidine kinase/phosphomethylpyrimidine kinase, partial [Hyphomicrobiales bacterium]
MIPIALTVAGSDSSGGAGIQADLKTFSALGVYGASVLAALTAQNTKGVTAIHAVPGGFIRAQMDAVLGDLDVRAIKIGMLGTAEAAGAVAGGLKPWPDIPVVLDPVMVAASGDPLLAGGAETALRDLFPLAAVITPNLAEAARLLGTDPAADEDAMREQAKALSALGARAVLV